jgi:hypothetical protein
MYDDATRANSDFLGDLCDTDDDNDGLLDATEGMTPPCASGSMPTSPTVADTDGDRHLDGAECALGSDPFVAASVPGVFPDGDFDRLPDSFETALNSDPADSDTDDDGLLDGVEFRFYNTSSIHANLDGDLCNDGKEAASINGDQTVSSTDIQQVAVSFGPTTDPDYLVNMDVDKNGNINSTDLLIVGQRFGACP